MPSVELPRQAWTHFDNLPLADPDFHKPRPIDMLLGAEIFADILLGGRKSGSEGQPTAFKTKFGWIISGQVSGFTPKSLISSHISFADSSEIDSTIKRFWELESVPTIENRLSKEEESCERSFAENCARQPDGRFEVSLPFKGPEPLFIDSRSIAMKRLLSLEHRLCKENLYESYKEFMTDYLSCGHMTPVPGPTTISHEARTYYIPHHCVLRPDSESTKLRVVFDASAKAANGVSLNDSLLIGPKLQKDVASMLCHFRLHKVVLTADVKQMYRQILITPAHRDYQRILWRFDTSEPIQEFQLNTVTYGINSSPFLALRTIIELANNNKDSFPRASKVLLEDTYVDDIVTGTNSIKEARDLVIELTELMKSAGFELRKWASNSPEALKTLPADHCRKSQLLPLDQNIENSIKILGLGWNPMTDILRYTVSPLTRSCTKRTILSELARIFDPLGFLAPLTLFAKHLIQQLWTLGLPWDEEPPEDIIRKWKRYLDELSLLASLAIPRRLCTSPFLKVELHAFCDASEVGYGAVIYFRFETANAEVITSLVCGKSKVAPLKRVSLPRLELCAAVLLSNLVRFVLTTYEGKLKFHRVCAWSDSKVTLAWIKSSPHRWQTFVSNRVSHIQEIVAPDDWFHVPSKDNPADAVSRGQLPQDLINNSLWWDGPSWLRPFDFRPTPVDQLNEHLSTEQRTEVLLLSKLDDVLFKNLLEKYSSLKTIRNIVAYTRRFLHNASHPAQKLSGPLVDDELYRALVSLVRLVQEECFADVIQRVKEKKSLSSTFRRLSLILDSSGCLRVGGRLSNSSLPYDHQHPMLLPRKHRLTTLIIEHFHCENLHVGLQTLHFLILQQFWILSARRAIRNVLSGCIRCFRVRPIARTPPMGDLPMPRVSQLKPFSHVGVDYAGPVSITLSKHRGVKTQKAYICIFVCLSVKAVHLELSSDLTTDAFLAAFRRFVARRGRCSDVYSDCGTNFVGANRTLLDMHSRNAAAALKIRWHFNPPASPNFGGIWEAGVKSVKTHLIRIIGDQILTFEEYYTVLVQIEAVLNSRPLFAISADPNDLTPLTPGHFLTLEPLTAIPDDDHSGIKIGRLSRWRLIQRCQQEFWKRWRTEYLSTLQQRPKAHGQSVEMKVDDLVIIKNENTSPLNWPLGRIVTLHPGADGISRVATVKTQKGLLQRPVAKLCRLPCAENSAI